MFAGQGQERVALRAAKAAPGLLAQEEDDKRKDQTEADREG